MEPPLSDTTPPIPPPLQPRGTKRSFPALRCIGALMLREMSTRYGRSPGGYAWALLEPLGGILILSIGFSLLLRSPPLGSSFLLFYATGMLPFTMYQSLATVVAKALTFSRSLLVYPVVGWIDAILARTLLNTLTNLLVTYILMAAILILVDTQVLLSMGPILLALLLSVLLGIGVGLVNCVLTGFFPVWATVWSIVTRPLFIASGVILLYESLPVAAQNVLWWNPLFHVTGLMRTGFFPMYDAAYVSVSYVAGVALVLIALGLVLVRRYYKTILAR